jgi:hypothetical protein
LRILGPSATAFVAETPQLDQGAQDGPNRRDQTVEGLAAAGMKAIVSGWGDEIVELAGTNLRW